MSPVDSQTRQGAVTLSGRIWSGVSFGKRRHLVAGASRRGDLHVVSAQLSHGPGECAERGGGTRHGAADGGGERRGSSPRGGLPLLALCRRAGRAVGRRGGRREELVEELLRPPAQVDPRPKVEVELPARGRRRRRRRRGLEGRGRERRRLRRKARRLERLRRQRRQRQRWQRLEEQRRQRSRLQRATHPEGDHPGCAGHSKQARNGRGRRVAQQHQLWSVASRRLIDDAMRWPQG
mmetsp:Transcript_15555/g.46495  ORF Transcript_15555/g.46495 Transcript_15555/m.46495 type:complete len:236 (-) Transcript_15555:276-983(-)